MLLGAAFYFSFLSESEIELLREAAVTLRGGYRPMGLNGAGVTGVELNYE